MGSLIKELLRLSEERRVRQRGASACRPARDATLHDRPKLKIFASQTHLQEARPTAAGSPALIGGSGRRCGACTSARNHKEGNPRLGVDRRGWRLSSSGRNRISGATRGCQRCEEVVRPVISLG